MLVLLVPFLILSCVTGGTRPPGQKEGSELNGELGTDETRNRPEKIEINGAIDFRDPAFRHLLDTSPVNGKPVFFAAVTRLYDREEEYVFGKRLLARQAAIFRGALVNAKTLTLSTAQYEGALEDVEVEFDRDRIESLQNNIEVVEYYEDNRGSYLKGVWKGVRLPDFQVPRGMENDAPDWFIRMPDYKGYAVSVGVSQRQMFFAESILESEKQTLANMARQFNVDIEKQRDDLEIEGLGTAYKQKNMEIVNVSFRGFYILDRRISADGNTFFTLAVAPVK